MKKCLSLAVCLTALLGVGCNVYPEEFERAKKSCEPHGGLYKYEPTWLADTQSGVWTGRCFCVDGTTIEQRDTREDLSKNKK